MASHTEVSRPFQLDLGIWESPLRSKPEKQELQQPSELTDDVKAVLDRCIEAAIRLLKKYNGIRCNDNSQVEILRTRLFLPLKLEFPSSDLCLPTPALPANISNSDLPLRISFDSISSDQKESLLSSRIPVGLSLQDHSFAPPRSTSSPVQKNRIQRQICPFCRQNGEEAIFHEFKDALGRVLCPVLSKFKCKLCGATGFEAHTQKFCPKNPLTKGDPIGKKMPPGLLPDFLTFK